MKNLSQMIVIGDDYAGVLFTKFNKQQMSAFALSEKEINSIMADVTNQVGQTVAGAGRVAVL